MRSLLLHRAALLGGILAAAFCIRLAFTLWTEPVPAHYSDAQYYQATAESLARGDGYSVKFGDDGFEPGSDASELWPPGYSMYLAGWYTAVGDELWVARAANVVAGSLTIVPIFFIGRRLFDERTALLAAAIAALLPSFVVWTPVLLSETLFTFLFACCIAGVLFSTSERRLQPALVIASALLIGVTALVRGQALVLVPVAAVWWMLNRVEAKEMLRWGATALVTVAAVLGAWTARNAIVMDDPTVLSANFGYNLRIGHADYSTGRYIVPGDLWEAQPGITFQEREILFNDLGSRRAIDYAASHPLDELELSGRKIMWLWRPDSDGLFWVSSFGETPLPDGAREPLRWAIDISYLAVVALALAGLSRLRSAALWTVLTPIALWTVAHIVFFGEPRYHLPMLAMLVPLAAGAIVWAIGRLVGAQGKRGRPGKVTGGLKASPTG
ncbi:MAG: glycosyltransferase family 39 protein [Dehalococcoidia bacterium]